MGISLSTEEMAEDFLKAGIEPRWGSFWSGRLEEWLAVALPPGAEERYSATGASGGEPGADRPGPHETVWEWTERRRQGVQTWSFPTNALHAEYLSTVSARSEADVLALLRLFLFEESCFGLDGDHLERALDSSDVRKFLDDLPKEYSRRLMRWMSGTAKPHPSIRWVLDLLPHAPQQAIDAVMGYLNVYRSLRPSGRSDGLLDAAAVIRARWIDDLSGGTEALFRLSPRDFEALVAALYRKLGYDVELTPPSRDGGRDVIASRELPGQREVIDVECKSHSSPIEVKHVRQLRGVIERNRTNRGVLVATGRFTRGARAEASSDPRLELINGEELIRLLNAHFGPLWTEDHDWISRGLT